jgi:ketohexokinase
MTSVSEWHGMSDKGRRILGVGVAALDIVNEVAAYPLEDAELRILARRFLRGGNAANTLAVLRQMGHGCSWAGTMGNDPEGAQVLGDLELRGIATGNCVRHPGGSTPTSYVVLSRVTGSRTILHYRDLPELSAADFAGIRLEGYDWVHFEGRDPEETAHMIRDCARRRLPGTRISLEVEKPRPQIESLFTGPDVIVFSRSYAESCGHADPRRFLMDQWSRTDARLLVVPWGEDGAYAQTRGDDIFYAPAHRPERVRDTLGAGDVFNAALIDGLLAELPVPMLLARCNALAGHKCGMMGMDDLVESACRAGVL